jgi:hypothetical protein
LTQSSQSSIATPTSPVHSPGGSPSATPVVLLIGWPTDAALDAIDAQTPGASAIVFEPAAPPPGQSAGRGTAAARWTDAGRLAVIEAPALTGAADLARRFPALGAAALRVAAGVDAATEAQGREVFARLRFGSDANEGARRATAARYLLHTLMNAPRLARESRVEALSGLLEGIPAVVVAAGPSLDRNIHDLAVVADRPLVIACDTAARPLLAVGVQPDIIVASDSSRANAAHLSSLPPSRSWLIAEASLHPSAFPHFDGRTFFFRVAAHEPWPWLQTLGLDAGILPTWGSVATSAFSLALDLGCNPIALIGADFAFTGGRPYCRGTSFESQWASWTGDGRTLEDVWQVLIDRWPHTTAADLGGVAVRTAPHLVSFRDWLLERAQAQPDRAIVNATGAGILSGPFVAQRSLTDTLASAPVMDRDLLHRVLRMAHGHGRGDAAALFCGIDALMADEHSPAVQAMATFGAPAAHRASIAAALRSPEYAAWALAHGRFVEDIP